MHFCSSSTQPMKLKAHQYAYEWFTSCLGLVVGCSNANTCVASHRFNTSLVGANSQDILSRFAPPLVQNPPSHPCVATQLHLLVDYLDFVQFSVPSRHWMTACRKLDSKKWYGRMAYWARVAPQRQQRQQPRHVDKFTSIHLYRLIYRCTLLCWSTLFYLKVELATLTQINPTGPTYAITTPFATCRSKHLCCKSPLLV